MNPSEGGKVEGGEGEQALPAWLDRAVGFRIPLHDVSEDGVDERFPIYALRRSDPEIRTGENDLTWLGDSARTIDGHRSLVGDAVRRTGTHPRSPITKSMRWRPLA